MAAGQPAPALYTRGPRDFERLCAEADVDLVYTATPWEWHVPVMLAALRHGKHAATEVPAAMTLDDCWAIVEAAEKYRLHCVMMENCNYDRFELMALHLVRQGLLGEVLHGEAAYLHDLREIKFSPEGEGSGAGPGPSLTTATSTPRTASARWPTAWTSTGAIASSGSPR